MIRYHSTRGSEETLTAAQAVIRGIAEDRGLYVPDSIPALPFTLSELSKKTYKETAKAVIGAFFTDYTEEELERCVNGAYDGKFDAEDVVSIVKAGNANYLELYHGRTAAFKDMALSILPYLLTTAMKKEKEKHKVCILTATSGDTGKAALDGFADVEGTEIVVFFPSSGVSKVQERQMITQEGENTHVFAIKGNFDDAQTGVKNIFGDKEFAEELEKAGCRLSSANSINIGRLIPQVAYYVYSYGKLVANGEIKEGDKINIVVPTGNFGNILAAYYASKMGIPVNRFICASNKNRVLTDFIESGKYSIDREFFLTNSPSMDILISSNLERLLYHLSGENGNEIKALMDSLDTDKEYVISDKIKEGLKCFYGGSCSVEDTIATIGKMYEENGYLMDTHTAVACKVYEDYRRETGDETPTVIASTASAYKFATSVADAIGIKGDMDGFECIKAINEKTGVKIPEGLRDLDKKEIRHKGVIDVNEMKKSVEESVK